MTSENEQRALNHLRRLLTIGQYPSGSRLPPERDLALELGMGRGPIRSALSTLEAEGKISRHIGQGTFVGSLPASRQSLPGPIYLQSANPSELMETRLTIEPRVAAMAAVRASEEDIDYLHLCVARSEKASDWEMWERWDATFHRTIGLASGNSILADLIEMMNKVRGDQTRRPVRQQAANPDWRPVLVNQHRAIVGAIKARDPEGAARAMRDHLRGVEERLFGDLEDLAKFVERL